VFLAYMVSIGIEKAGRLKISVEELILLNSNCNIWLI